MTRKTSRVSHATDIGPDIIPASTNLLVQPVDPVAKIVRRNLLGFFGGKKSDFASSIIINQDTNI
ncbi:hypothetical protein A2533_00565 [Candidatus Falkowbacteria bacterium RIFOXYD2_FULL_35_9]|uniref:Uncharacterized protein n=1 Tax=Candidatus Falkowbacteria bacterium RIFOXYC2_FULL_36_12 TaxID=1798002 RepID=A0A1F5T010_9BACT|nr:MAG: hypothetical protein A2300_04185 [Candidatus Falkowbacteria bacterium RIFOXYB2_FULL_35_7]OGF32290.1 MAG: hypothetical protein A2478_03110 [Candidatus Falkowbacteria bacterium RIFOXYC2_FULL_36_12]OGF34146.1 MAG: hypothetical protein A2223_00485 [Candidatus Falkowbacteria bacterium RIFOXYA2_FULL_35_8]OGF46657.1 MAG: hypothetical protein A2533_00565 [Candidatus Falkowbacteria bacterium RIFOXYD2_FULL_35_9]